MSKVNPVFLDGEFPSCTNGALEFLSLCLEGYHVIDSFKERALSYLGGRSKGMREHVVHYLNSEAILDDYYQIKNKSSIPNAYDSAMVLLSGFITGAVHTTKEYESLIKKSKQLIEHVSFSFDDEEEKEGFIHRELSKKEQIELNAKINAYIEYWYENIYLSNKKRYSSDSFKNIFELWQKNQVKEVRVNIGVNKEDSKVNYISPKEVIAWIKSKNNKLIISLMVQTIEEGQSMSFSVQPGNESIESILNTLGVLKAEMYLCQ